MTNILTWPSSGKPPHQRAAHRRLVAPLNERVALQNFAVKRQQFYANPNTENEAEMLRARDAWTEAYQALHGSVA